jgi:hypothetical protein
MVVFQHDIPESRNLQGAALASIGEWALRAGVAGRVEQVFDCSHSLAPEIRRAADLPSDENGALAGLAIGWVPRPPMLLAFADRTGLEQNRSCPSFDGPEGGRRSFSISMEITPPRHAIRILGRHAVSGC